ncbi:MAG: AraC family transcriptional regulator [Saprospiraceae bacterium]|nr:AraC family transcriptional regulator [Saprospiraceae bacterium]
MATSKIELLFFDQGIYSLKQDGKEEPVSRSSFYGQSTSFKHYIAAVPRSSIFGITFSPLAALTLLRIPANELSQQTVDINSILGYQGNELSEKIYEARSFEQKTIIATDFFNNRLKELHLKYLSVEKLILSIDQTHINSVPELVANSFLSQRQFERNFKELTGFSAKTYLKIKRFERFIANASLIVNKSESKLIDIALDVGYYDQAHLNRHFKEFTGLNPKAYFQNLILQESKD